MADPSEFFLRHVDALRQLCSRGPVLDVASGRGRHALAVAALGAHAVALDRDGARLAELAGSAAAQRLRVSTVRTDLEGPGGLPVIPASCAAVLVFRYLSRPLAPQLAACLQPGGLLLYETFTLGQRDVPEGPSNPDFLLRPGELKGLFPELHIELHEEELRVDAQGRRWHLARLAARRR